jgi:hypothetical protein
VQGDRDRYVDYSPGDIIGLKLIGAGRSGSQPTINCDPDDIYPNTNLRGSVAFMFPDADVIPDGFDPQDAINPWLPCPCIQTELQDQGLIYTTLKTWVGVSWNYSCDTGLVSFRAVWGGWGNGSGFYAWQQYYQMVNQLAGADATTTADPDWYLGNEITIPYATENDTNRLSRFSMKLRLTCDQQSICEPYDCYPICVANTCPGDPPDTVNAVSPTLTWDGTDIGHFEYSLEDGWSFVLTDPFSGWEAQLYCTTPGVPADGQTLFIDPPIEWDGPTSWVIHMSCTGGTMDDVVIEVSVPPETVVITLTV